MKWQLTEVDIGRAAASPVVNMSRSLFELEEARREFLRDGSDRKANCKAHTSPKEVGVKLRTEAKKSSLERISIL